MFINYGDRNFLEYGILVDEERATANDVHILYCRPFDDLNENGEQEYLFADCHVDITDDWIDWNGIKGYSGISYNDDMIDIIELAIACIEYYGIDNFCDWYTTNNYTKKDIDELLKEYLIAWDYLVVEE